MKFKNLLLGLTLLFSTVALAQEKGDFNGFAGVSYPLSSGADLGITAGVEYVFAENFSAAPSFTYYTSSGVTNTALNVDARYYLGSDSFNWFVTAGLSFRSTSGDIVVNGVNVGSVSVSDTGFGGGAGALFALSDSIDLLAVVRYDSSLSAVEPMVCVSFGF